MDIRDDQDKIYPECHVVLVIFPIYFFRIARAA